MLVLIRRLDRIIPVFFLSCSNQRQVFKRRIIKPAWLIFIRLQSQRVRCFKAHNLQQLIKNYTWSPSGSFLPSFSPQMAPDRTLGEDSQLYLAAEIAFQDRKVLFCVCFCLGICGRVVATFFWSVFWLQQVVA